MYQAYYGFQEMPFSITPDPKFLYLSRAHEEALAHLKFGIEQKKGFMVLTGEVGCGKTTLCRRLLDDIEGQEHYESALILNPRVTETQLMRLILIELGCERIPRSRHDLMERVNEVLLEKFEAGKELVLIVDEAQNMSFETLEHLRLLSNLETDKQKLLQIILMGQPELKALLNEPRLRQLKQRVLVHYDLDRLGFEDTCRYVQHRLLLAGGNVRARFTRFALRKVYAESDGTPRLINALCDKSLLAAFARSSEEVNWWDVRRASREMKELSQ